MADVAEPADLSRELREQLRVAFQVREAALELAEERGIQEDFSFPLTISLSDDADQVASAIRSALSIEPNVQRGWRDSYEALRSWRKAVEQLGVLVMQLSGIDLEEMRGFSVSEFPAPLICLNSKDHVNGRIFTLAHELVHLALHQGGICEWDRSQERNEGNTQIERFCNLVAGAILVPEKELFQDWDVFHADGPRIWSDREIRRLARQFSVSREVVLRRLVIVGKASEVFYRRKREEYLEEYARLTKKKGGPVPWEKRVVHSLGGSFVTLVLGSYYERRLSLADASRLIGVRVSHLPRIEQEVLGWSHIRTAGS